MENCPTPVREAPQVPFVNRSEDLEMPSRPAPVPVEKASADRKSEKKRGSKRHSHRPQRPAKPLPPLPPKHKLNKVKDKVEKRLIKHRKLVEEVLSTEKTYVRGLNELESRFHVCMQIHHIVSEAELKVMFGNLSSLIVCHEELLKSLEKELQHDTPCLGHIFVELSPYFKLYVAYVNSYMDMSLVVEKLKNTILSGPGKILEENLDKRLGGVQGLESRLITPVQRIPRYKLLLKELIRNTPKDHKDYEALHKAFDSISTLAKQINEKRKDHENNLRILEVSRHLTGNQNMLAQSTALADLHEDGRHKFRKYTFTKPTWCDYCGKFIYGALLQGKNCKKCSMSVHHICAKSVDTMCQGTSTPTLVAHNRQLIGEYQCMHNFVDPKNQKTQKNAMAKRDAVVFLFNDSLVVVYPSVSTLDEAVLITSSMATPDGMNKTIDNVMTGPSHTRESIEPLSPVSYELCTLVRWYSFSKKRLYSAELVSGQLRVSEPRGGVIHTLSQHNASSISMEALLGLIEEQSKAWIAKYRSRFDAATSKEALLLISGNKEAEDGSAVKKEERKSKKASFSHRTLTFEILNTVLVASGSGKFTAYVIHMHDGEKESTLLKRYSQFVTLHQSLAKSTYNLRELPKLPRKQLLGNLSADTIQYRCRKLTAYLNALVLLPGIFELSVVSQFLMCNTDDQSAVSDSEDEEETKEDQGLALDIPSSASEMKEGKVSSVTKVYPRRPNDLKAEALYDFISQSDTELSFKKGDLMNILNDEDPDWVYVSLHGRVGFVPRKYLLFKKESSE